MPLVALVPILVASLLGSLHCVGMCGGLVALYAGDGSGRRIAPHLAYHGTRLVGYVVLGTIAGALGGALDLAGAAVGVGRVAAVVAGAGMALWGVVILKRALGRPERLVTLRRPATATVLGRVSAWFLRGLEGRAASVRGALLGGLSALLPCGWLYAFVLGAGATASAWQGALVMVAFWSGTVPLLLGFGLGVQGLLRPLRRHLPTITACGLIVAGALTVVSRGTVPGDAFEQLRAADFAGRGTLPSDVSADAMEHGATGSCPLHNRPENRDLGSADSHGGPTRGDGDAPAGDAHDGDAHDGGVVP